jgi:large subunit ribosomal protein L24
MSTKKFKKGDVVLITAGRDKGKSGKITKINHKLNTLVVEGVALYKKNIKPTQNNSGGTKSIERPISFAKVAFLQDGKPVRIGLKKEQNKTIRISKKTGKAI